MATQKQIDANRKNAARSTGPKTEAGKAIARLNSITHGFRTQGLDKLPRESAEAFQANLDAWYADYAPANETEARLVRQAAVLSWKLDRAERLEATLLARRVREAVANAEEAQRQRLNHALSQLLPPEAEVENDGYGDEPAAELLETIEGSAVGCHELIYQWQLLRDRLQDSPCWGPEREMHAIRLSGGGPQRISDPRVLDLVVANRMLKLSDEVLVEPFHGLESSLGLTFDQHAAFHACLRLPQTRDEAKKVLISTADREIARLQEVLVIRERDGDLGAEEIQEAAELATFDMSSEATQLRKYQDTMQRQFVKTVEAIPKLQLQEIKLDQGYAKLAEIRASEPNLEAADPEPEITPENRASEPNFAPEVQVTFTPERKIAVEPVVPSSRNEGRRARKNRQKALLRRLGKA